MRALFLTQCCIFVNLCGRSSLENVLCLVRVVAQPALLAHGRSTLVLSCVRNADKVVSLWAGASWFIRLTFWMITVVSAECRYTDRETLRMNKHTRIEEDDVPSPIFPDCVKSLNPEIETCTFFLTWKCCKNVIMHQWGSNLHYLDWGMFTKLLQKQGEIVFARNNGNSCWTEGCNREKKEVSTTMSAVVSVELTCDNCCHAFRGDWAQ